MRASRVVVVATACAAILAVGYVLAPEPTPALELVTPASTPADDQEASP
ncbi:hypothetical protein [Demequina sp.]|nr:hypothetical protein [Demequina sp.]